MIEWMLLLAGALIAAFAVASETGVYYANRLRVRSAAERGRRSGQILSAWLERPGAVVITALLVAETGVALAALGTALWLEPIQFPAAVLALLAAALLFVPLAIVARWLPARWMERAGDRGLYLLLRPLAVLVRLMSAAAQRVIGWSAQQLGLINRKTSGAAAGDQIARARMFARLREGASRRELSAFQRELLDRFVNLANVRVASVMIPRARAATLPANVSRDDFLRVAKMAHFSRIPVYDRTTRRMVGVVNVYDVLTDDTARPISAYIQPTLSLAPTESVATALVRLRQARQSMAIVEDRAGNCEGILTVKDLAEEIVGELEAW